MPPAHRTPERGVTSWALSQHIVEERRCRSPSSAPFHISSVECALSSREGESVDPKQRSGSLVPARAPVYKCK